MSTRNYAVFIDDMGYIGAREPMTEAELARRNHQIEMEGRDEFGMWQWEQKRDGSMQRGAP